MGELQAHTFTPLWISFILVVNAVLHRRTGRCFLLDRTRGFLLLFPASAAFWWSFEYLNRFVGNWCYVGGREFGATEYFLFATLPFATVLPAVLSVRELLLSYPPFDAAFRDWRSVSPGRPHGTAAAALLLSCAGLLAVGFAPDIVFPLVWVAPPLLLISLSGFRGRPHALSGIAGGDWRRFRRLLRRGPLLRVLLGDVELPEAPCEWVYDIPYVERASTSSRCRSSDTRGTCRSACCARRSATVCWSRHRDPRINPPPRPASAIKSIFK